MKLLLWLIITVFLVVPRADAKVWLNEISAGSSPEYIELYNSDSIPINLVDWYLDDIIEKGSSPKKFSIELPGNGFGVIELNSIFNNSGGDSVRLLDNNEVEIDHYDYTINLSLNDIFIRCPDGGDAWVSTTIGSKEKSNLDNCLLLTPSLTPQPTLPTANSPTPTSPFLPTPTVHTTPGVLLTEVMVYPDNESEWAEIYNPQDSSVTLNGWYLDDGQNSGSSPKSFSLTIPAKSYKVIYLNTQIFNNSADTVRLLNSEFAEIDGFDYDGAEKSQSFSRQSLIKDDSWCLTNPSPNQANSTCLQTISGLTDTKITEPTPTVIPTEISKIIQSESSIIPPAGLILSDNFYKLPQPKVLGAKTSPPCSNQAELVFWQQFTKISLWLNLLISVLFLIHLSFSLPVFSRFYAG